MNHHLATLLLIAGCTAASYAASPDTLTIALTGDIMMGTTYPDTLLPSHDGAHLFRDVKHLLRRADLAVGNLEGTLCDGGESTKEGPNQYAFRTPTTYGHWLNDAGYDFLSMANNHANDFGPEGIEATENVLRQQGILYAGLKGRTETAILHRKGIRIGFCAFGHNPYTLQHTDLHMATVKRTIHALKQHADLIVVSIHGGAEGQRYSHLPDTMEIYLQEQRGHLRQLAHTCIELGADVVYGHGPHVVRGVEVYHGRFIAYSLGNFCTPYGVNLSGISGYAPLIEIKTDLHGQFLSGQIHSFIQQRGHGPRYDKTGRVTQQIKTLSTQDLPASEAFITTKGHIRRRQ